MRRRMERAMGDDLSSVRIHTDAQAESAVERQGAVAMAYGDRIAFGAGRYQPGTPLGDALLAHEPARPARRL